jgi:DtxR family transcriptional regulator, Mn-dependent transcriptional regulator
MFEKKLLEKLGHKDTCPHGNGLSLRSPADRQKKGMSLLSEAVPNTEYTIASVYERDSKLLEFLDGHGLRPGARVKIETRNYDGTLSLLVDKRPVHLGVVVAEKLWLSKSEPKQKQSRSS